MADFLARLSDAVLGDPTLLGMQPRVPSYEDSHAEVQSILLPPQVPKGLSVQALQPLNKNLALTHRRVARYRDMRRWPVRWTEYLRRIRAWDEETAKPSAWSICQR